jgi:hypothetical protein
MTSPVSLLADTIGPFFLVHGMEKLVLSRP